jgi:hypothetical protein
MTEPKAKKNPDYSESAVKLTNPESLKTAMENYHAVVFTARKLEEELETTETYKKLVEVNARLNAWEKEIKILIEQDGSYQDIEKGVYAVKQRRISYQYDAAFFAEKFPNFAPAVIKQIVDITKLNGLLKGGLIKMEELLKSRVAQENETYAYIIK